MCSVVTLCDPMNCSPGGSSVHGTSQARMLEWLPFPSPGDLPLPGIQPTFSRARLFRAWTATCVKRYLHLVALHRTDAENSETDRRAILVASWGAQNLPAVQETQVQSLGWEDPQAKGMTPHSNILAWRIPGTEEPGGLQPMGSQRIRHNWATNTQTQSIKSP